MSESETGQDLPETDAVVAEPEKVEAESTPQDESKDESRVQKRINKLTWEKHEAERKARELEERLTALEQPKPDLSQAISDIKVPQYADYASDEDYQAALQSYNVQTFERLQETTQTQAEADKARQEREAKHAAYQDKVAAYAEVHEGFVDALMNSNVNISDSVQQVLFESDKAAELTHWMAENAAEAVRINNLPPILAAKELGRIEASLEAVAPKKVSSAPPPQTDISGSDDSVTSGLRDDMDIDDWMAKRRAQLIEKYGRL